jgi:hypothetical protein
MSERSVLFEHHPHRLTLAHRNGAAPPPPKVNEFKHDDRSAGS